MFPAVIGLLGRKLSPAAIYTPCGPEIRSLEDGHLLACDELMDSRSKEGVTSHIPSAGRSHLTYQVVKLLRLPMEPDDDVAYSDGRTGGTIDKGHLKVVCTRLHISDLVHRSASRVWRC